MGLIDTSAEIKKHNSAVAFDIEITGVQSFIDDAINQHIIPAIGRDTFNELVAAKSNLTDLQRPVFDLVQKSCVGFLLAYYSVSGALQIDSGGISVIKGSNSMPASDKKLSSLRKDSFEKGYNSLELAISYLEDHIINFTAYQASNEHKRNRSMLINTSFEFQQAGVNIGNNAQLYQVLRGSQVYVEDTYIYPLLGDELTLDIKGVILNGGASDLQNQLIEQIRKPIANLTLMEAIPTNAISIDATGIYQLSESVGGMAANVETKASASEARLQSVMYHLHVKGESQLESLRKWITKRKNDFPLYSVRTEVIINDDPNSNIYFL